ncbi:MAG: enoyl-CoA hydratase-related protein [Bacteroidales bacterium]|nr:enoyl-CoA hydratase-related protein [Bacteroidales bacterium]
MKELNTIQIEFQDAVSTIWLNRPEKHNAMNAEMIGELTGAFEQLIVEPETRLIIIRGRGKSYCAGADLNYMKEIASYGHDENYQDAIKLASLFERVYTCPKPVMAVLHGSSYGGANGLSAACDLVLADVNTVFAFSEVNIGITPATISPYVIRRCGEAAAREMMLTGRRFTAHEAARFMLVNRVFTADDAEEQINYYSSHFLTSGPQAIAQCKQLLQVVSSTARNTSELMRFTANMIASQRASAEGQEGISSFFEKRHPNWVKKEL